MINVFHNSRFSLRNGFCGDIIEDSLGATTYRSREIWSINSTGLSVRADLRVRYLNESEGEGEGAGGYAVVERGSQSSSLFEMIVSALAAAAAVVYRGEGGGLVAGAQWR